MRVGDVIVHLDGPLSGGLVCGSGAYTHAICVSVDPFVLVSKEGDMLWRCQQIDQFIALCQASSDVTKVAFARYTRDLGKLRSLGEEDIFRFLSKKYVQTADKRQREMGLVYMTAETHDLAKEIVKFLYYL